MSTFHICVRHVPKRDCTQLHVPAAARFIAGVGISAEFPVAFALLAEFSPKRLRHIFVGGRAIGYSLGWFICAVVATAVVPIFGWRVLFWIGVAPSLMIIYVRRYVPESVRFLLQQGRIQEAVAITRKLARSAGFTDVELVPTPSAKVQAKPTLTQQYSALRISLAAVVALGLFQLANNVQVVCFGTWLPSIFV